MDTLNIQIKRLIEITSELQEAQFSNDQHKLDEIYEDFTVNMKYISKSFRRLTNNYKTYNISQEERDRRADNMRKNRKTKKT